MANAKRDDNRVTVGLAFDGSVTQPLKVNPSTARLLIGIERVSSFPATSDPDAQIDDNRIAGSLVFDDTDVKPLLTDSSGNLILDVNVE